MPRPASRFSIPAGRSSSMAPNTLRSTTGKPGRRSTRSIGSSAGRSPTGRIDRATGRAVTCWRPRIDGKTPSVLVVRGTYGLMKVDAWTLRNRKLEKIWRWTNERAPFMYQGQGQHSVKVADIDGDGADEIERLHRDRQRRRDDVGHRPGRGSVLRVGHRPGPARSRSGTDRGSASIGVSLWDALARSFSARARPPGTIRSRAARRRHRRGVPRAWKSGPTSSSSARRGRPFPVPVPQNELVWWDADDLRETHARARSRSGRAGPRADAGLRSARGRSRGRLARGDLDRRAGELRICSTSIPARNRRVCLMQDPLYNDVTHRSMGYPHVPMTSYYLACAAGRSRVPPRPRARREGSVLIDGAASPDLAHGAARAVAGAQALCTA